MPVDNMPIFYLSFVNIRIVRAYIPFAYFHIAFMNFTKLLFKTWQSTPESSPRNINFNLRTSAGNINILETSKLKNKFIFHRNESLYETNSDSVRRQWHNSNLSHRSQAIPQALSYISTTCSETQLQKHNDGSLIIVATQKESRVLRLWLKTPISRRGRAQDAGRAFLWVPYFPWNFQIGTRRAGINRGGAFGGFRSAVNVSNVVAPRKASNSFVLVHPLPMCARSTLAPCVAVCVYLHACTPEARRLVPVHLYVCIRLFVCSCARVYFSNA